MKLEAPKNPNYAAVVTRVKALVPLENCDNIVGMPIFGMQAIVGKNTQVGDLGIVFPTECQLSDGYARINGLYRHSDKNMYPDQKGFLEDNRRVRAIRLRGHRSDALFMPISSVEFALGKDLDKLQEGDTFDELGGYEICQKYIIKQKFTGQRVQMPKAEKRVDSKLFPEHFDSTQWLRIDRNIPDDTILIVTQKIHGTSIRIGNVPVKRKLSLIDKIAKKIGVKIQEVEYSPVYGSRKVIKDANNPNQQHYYDSDLYSLEGHKLDGLIPKNYIVYGELVGWTESGAPIQKHYTYRCLPGTRKLYVYRVSTINPDGIVSDLSWDSIQSFCASLGLETVKELWRGTKADMQSIYTTAGACIQDLFTDVKFHETGLFPQAISLSDDSPCDEGVCIRIEGMIPQIYKLKSPIFLNHETKMLDQDVTDIEELQLVDEPL